MLTYVTINLFNSPAQTLINTVNTVGVMGKGIALSFKQLYPEMYQEYRHLCQEKRLDIGKLHIYRTPHKIVINFPTKKHWRNPSKVEYIEKGLQEFVKVYDRYGVSSVSFPQLGCGNGEFNWEQQVQPMMEQYLKNLPIPVYIHLYPKSSKFVPERLDANYAQQVSLERQIIPFEQVWQDLQTIITRQKQLDMFEPRIEIDEESICIKQRAIPTLTVYYQDLEDLWNTLRLTGTISIHQVPEPIRADGAIPCLFDILSRLSYISPIDLQPIKHNVPSKGLQYTPPAQTNPVQTVEMVV